MLIRLPPYAAPLALAGVLLAACGDPGAGPDLTPDGGGTVDAGPVARANLAFTTASVALLYGEEAEIEVRYLREDGTPAANAQVQLGLLGEAHDTSLEATCSDGGGAVVPCLTPLTDAFGIAVATVRAGVVPAVFRVQARVADLPPATLDVSVSDAEVGTLSVSVPYDGLRAVDSRTVRLFTGADCGTDFTDLLARTADRSRTVGPMLSRVELTGLPDSRRYTLLVLGRGAEPPGSGARPTLALGCLDDVAVSAGRREEVVVGLADLPTVVDGSYAAGVVIVGSAHPPRIGEAVLGNAEDAVAAAGSAEALVLDQLDALLAAAGAEAALEALAMERSGPGAAALRARLEGSRQGPLDGATWLAQTLEAAVGTLALDGSLHIAIAEPVPSVWTVDGVLAGIAPDAVSLATATLPGLRIEANLDWTLPSEARFTRLRVAVPLGSTAVATIAGLLEREDAPSTAHLLADELGCDAIATWVNARPEIASACGVSCVRQVCEASFGAATGGLETRLRGLDARRAAVELEGRASLTADTEERLERATAERLEGSWVTESGDGFDSVTAGVVATRTR